MKSLFKLAAIASLSLSLIGCMEGGSSSTQALEEIPSFSTLSKASLVDIERLTTGFETGSSLSIRKVFVFFDPQCSYCAALWKETKSLSSQAKFIWIPVSLMNTLSEGQGAAILNAEDSVAFMDHHEELLMQNRRGAPAMKNIPSELKTSIKRNTEVFNKLGAGGVPFVIGTNPLKNEVVKFSGGVSAAEFARKFGWSF